MPRWPLARCLTLRPLRSDGKCLQALAATPYQYADRQQQRQVLSLTGQGCPPTKTRRRTVSLLG